MVTQNTINSTSNNLRILMIVDGFYPAIGGAEKQARLLSRELAAKGHRVEVLAPLLEHSQLKTTSIDGVPIMRLRYPRIRLLGSVALWFTFLVWLWRRRHDYDAIHIHMVKHLAAAAGLLRPWLKATITVKVSGAWEFDGGLLDSKLKHNPFYRWLNWCVQRVDTVQCISEFTREKLREAHYREAQLRMIPNAVDNQHFDVKSRVARAPNSAAHVVYVGRLRKLKGLDVLLDAWRHLPRNAARLTIAGDGDQMDVLKQLLVDYNLSDSVTLLGATDAVKEVLLSADIYVQPSFQEGMPNSVLEAMAAHLPIVATRISGNEDVVRDQYNGLLVPVKDPAALTQALMQLINDPALAITMGQHSRDMIDTQFCTTAVIAKLEKAYRGDANV